MNSWHIRQAVRQLRLGGIIAYPTDTVYGLGCDPFNAAATLQLIALKQRSIKQGLILIASELQQLEPCLRTLPANVRRRITRSRNTPITWVLPCHDWVPEWLRGDHETLAVRITDHPVVVALCQQFNGPLVSSSANRHGLQPANDSLAVRKAFAEQLDYILHSKRSGTGQPSQIRNGLNGEILRGND